MQYQQHCWSVRRFQEGVVHRVEPAVRMDLVHSDGVQRPGAFAPDLSGGVSAAGADVCVIY
eukprot:CAMPEP_0119426754 /NCGR_PEP_ID=MMETSP1335-20130426/36946_1 /TAXON_ID=259385 /ORGANISM="Chrysoculter rhomboideus, Strain RCC1486" /LENGTH=60 /DNA_ID=CAMNT_0007452361 /DNA_START=71 /DNA_END=253 /DNA_ORIENTATION=+